MDLDFWIGILAVIFFVGAISSWAIGWRIRGNTVSLVALQFAVLFSVAGVVTLLLWRVTSS